MNTSIAAGVLGGLLWFGSLAWVGNKAYDAGVNAEKAAQGEREAVAEQAAEAVVVKVVKAVSKIEVKSDTHIQPVRTEIRTNTVYRDCSHSADGLRNLNALITGEGGTEGPVTGPVP